MGIAKRRDRGRRPGRRPGSRERKPLILIVCEGEVTEPQYFRGFVRWWRNPRVTIEIVPGAGQPEALVNLARSRKIEASARAKRERDSNLLFDQVWCVFDVDDHPGIPEARRAGQAAGIECAISNPCFELWLLLHFDESPGTQHRQNIRRRLEAHCPDDNKHVDFSKLGPGYPDAVRRAKDLERVATSLGEEPGNPSTRVHVLTELIRGDGASATASH